MKKVFFMVVLLCITLWQNTTFSQSLFYPLNEATSSIKLTFPLENSVIQYGTSDIAQVPFAGQVLVGTKYSENVLANRIYLRVQKYNYQTSQWSTVDTKK